MSKSDIESNVNNKTNTSIISDNNNNTINSSNNGNNRVHFLDSEHLDITADVIQLSNDPPTDNITPVFSQESDSVLGGPTEFSFIHTLNLLILNSFLGTVIRLGLNALFKYRDQQVFEAIYAQLFGSFLFGFLQSTQQTVLRNNLNLFLGFATGLCGCITTFSSFSLNAFTNLFHINAKSGVLQGILSAITVFVITLTGSLSSLKYGKLLGKKLNNFILERRAKKLLNQNTSKSNISTRSEPIIHDCFIKYVLLFLASVVPWTIIIVTCIWIPQGRNWTISIALSPFGTLLRFLLRRLNALSPSFFWGTYAANILGTGILGVLFILQQERLGYCGADSDWKCEIVFGFANGFCACLTTISTFVSELNSLHTKKSHIYALVSVVSGQIILLVIVGSWVWSN